MTIEAFKVGGEFQVNTENSFFPQQDPTITSLKNGNFVVSWTTAYAYEVKAQIFRADGAKVSDEFVIGNGADAYQWYPTIASLENGGFVVSWSGSSYHIKAQMYSPSGATVGGEILVDSEANGFTQTTSTVTGLVNGGFVVSWVDTSGLPGDTNFGIKGQIFAANGTKIGSEFLIDSAASGGQIDPVITGLAGGGFIVSWWGVSQGLGDDSSTSIQAQVFAADGTRIGAEFLVNTVTAQDQRVPAITALSTGGFVISWQDGSNEFGGNSSDDIKAQIYNADGTKSGGELLINSELSMGQYAPTVSALANGGFVVSWVDTSELGNDNSLSGIKAQLFSRDGSKVGYEFLVNTMTEGNQVSPTIASLGNGGFVISWVENDFYPYTPIKAQIFSISGAPEITSNGGGVNAAISIAENQTAVTTVKAIGSSSALAYSISGGADAAQFSIDASTGALSFRAPPDFETPTDAGTNNVYDVIVRASDGPAFDEQALAITITDVPNVAYTGTASVDFFNGAGGREWTISGLGGNDILSGNSDADQIFGGTGNDVLTGAAGNDILKGEAGNDSIYGDEGNDQIDGGDGNDILFGGQGNDMLKGGAGADILNGGAGADTMAGGAGNDIYAVNDQSDIVTEAANEGRDTVNAGVSFASSGNIEIINLTDNGGNINATGDGIANTITGNADDNILTGLGGKDVISGGAGNDTLIGGALADTLTGGAGADRFVFDSLAVSADKDVIKDFVAGTDVLAITRSVFSAFANDPPGAILPSAFRNGAAAANADEHLIYNAATGALFYDVDGKGGAAQVQIAVLSGRPTLSAADFVLVDALSAPIGPGFQKSAEASVDGNSGFTSLSDLSILGDDLGSLDRFEQRVNHAFHSSADYFWAMA